MNTGERPQTPTQGLTVKHAWLPPSGYLLPGLPSAHEVQRHQLRTNRLALYRADWGFGSKGWNHRTSGLEDPLGGSGRASLTCFSFHGSGSVSC